MFKRVPGTKDILPPEISQWQKIEEIGRKIFSLYNYQEIRTPIIEQAALFNRSLGESTEIVCKQMFLVRKEQDTYCLRPEGTASVVRAYIENSLDKTQGFIKLYYIAPMFRAERPQKGRLRQFHHIGCEVIGSSEPEVDIEVISLSDRLLKSFSVEGYQIQINSLGCLKDKKKLVDLLRQQLRPKVNKLCDDCRARFKGNILRILDCKNESCRELVSELDIQAGHLCLECKTHFEKVRRGLDALSLNYKLNPYLVRGLDYYTRTVFEIKHAALGSQDAIGAGGRYDNLIKELGGLETPAMGFAFGIERLILALTKNQLEVSARRLIYIIALGEEAKIKALQLADELRSIPIVTATNLETKSLKAQMRKANDLGASEVLIIGEDELKKGALVFKDMHSGEQKEIEFGLVLKELKGSVC
jgi:histidyl-tRNA synthetase